MTQTNQDVRRISPRIAERHQPRLGTDGRIADGGAMAGAQIDYIHGCQTCGHSHDYHVDGRKCRINHGFRGGRCACVQFASRTVDECVARFGSDNMALTGLTIEAIESYLRPHQNA